MEQKLIQLLPEIALFVAACVVMIIGQSRTRSVRQLCAPISALGLLAAAFAAIKHSASPEQIHTAMPFLPEYGKVIVAGIGLLLLLLVSGTADRDLEADVDSGRGFEPLRSIRGEFYAFFLFSLMGLMLCAGADDLIWLFLALELTSLPTYVMVSLSTSRNRSMEAGVKYFFLGALGAAIFLYGFVMIYGGTGHTGFGDIAAIVRSQAASPSGINSFVMLGLVLSIVGIGFKIAAVPMHFYTADVYQGASASMAGFLAFVPKSAGFFSIMLLCSLAGWAGGAGPLPDELRITLWILAVATMTVGNVLAVMQHSVKRILAYSSVAHSGYMLVGIVAGPGGSNTDLTRNGLAAVLFYLASYGIMTVGSFAAVACLEKRRPDGRVEEADSIDDFRGLVKSHPAVAWVMIISAMGLLGLPPLLGFLGKLPLFTAGIGAGEITLVVILGVNSAIAAYYYLRLAYVCFIEPADPAPAAIRVQRTPFGGRLAAGVLSVAGIIGLAVYGKPLADFAVQAGSVTWPSRSAQQSMEKMDKAMTPQAVEVTTRTELAR